MERRAGKIQNNGEPVSGSGVYLAYHLMRETTPATTHGIEPHTTMTRLHASTELQLTTAGHRAAVVAKKLCLASEAQMQQMHLSEAKREAVRGLVSGLGYWLTLDTSG
jgi:hypothetical protein